jgi:CheY-like chemotaxis protein
MKTIVIIDDEFGLVDVLEATLSDSGYRALSAVNGQQGLQVMAEHPPDLVILDFMMPLVDGPGVLRAMRDDPRLASVRVIVMSAMPEAEVQARCLSYFAFLRKPFSFETLLALVSRALPETA